MKDLILNNVADLENWFANELVISKHHRRGSHKLVARWTSQRDKAPATMLSTFNREQFHAERLTDEGEPLDAYTMIEQNLCTCDIEKTEPEDITFDFDQYLINY